MSVLVASSSGERAASAAPGVLVTMAWTGSPINVKREVLIGFDLLLAVVVGLVLYAASARDPQAPPDFFDSLQLLLVVSALAGLKSCGPLGPPGRRPEGLHYVRGSNAD